jgi:hypothetical protein
VGDFSQKDKQKAEQDERKRRADIDDQDTLGDSQVLGWDEDVEEFMEELDKHLNGFRVSMSSTEFRTLHHLYRELSMAERRAVANRMQRKRLPYLLRALHANDYRAYVDTWQAEAKMAEATEETVGGRGAPGGDGP